MVICANNLLTLILVYERVSAPQIENQIMNTYQWWAHIIEML